jgi:hypothetical protein
VIDRSKTRDTPEAPVALHEATMLFATLVAETILASAHVLAPQQAGQVDASDLIIAQQNSLRGAGRSQMELGRLTYVRTSWPLTGLGSYQRPYALTVLVHGAAATERMRSGVSVSQFQAAQQRPTMVS